MGCVRAHVRACKCMYACVAVFNPDAANVRRRRRASQHLARTRERPTYVPSKTFRLSSFENIRKNELELLVVDRGGRQVK